jgi:hypothetical protein
VADPEPNGRAPARPCSQGDGSLAPPRPAYEPPRIVKKRSVSRATLFSGGGPSGGGPPGPGLTSSG